MSPKNWLAAIAIAAVGCGGNAPQEETTPEPQPEPVVEAPAPAPMPEPDPEDVHIEGNHITIDRHINFETDSDVILEDSSDLLDHIALLLSHHTEDVAHLRIIGHTDAAGGHDHNQELSERRAASVLNALRERGVTTQLESAGVGETEPVCSEDTDECHASNRRVEFLIIVDDPTAGGEAE